MQHERLDRSNRIELNNGLIYNTIYMILVTIIYLDVYIYIYIYMYMYTVSYHKIILHEIAAPYSNVILANIYDYT